MSCTKNCNVGGKCVDNICNCFFGFFHDKSLNQTNCNYIPIMNQMTFWTSTRIIFAILYWVLLIWVVCGLTYHLFLKKHQLHLHTKKIGLFCLLWLTVITAVNLTIDPEGLEGIINPFAAYLLYESKMTIMFALCASIVFNWIDLYQKGVKRMRQVESIRKINSSYDVTVTIEDALKSIKFFNSKKLPFSIGIAINLAIVEVLCILQFTIAPQFAFFILFGWHLVSVIAFFILVILGIRYAKKIISIVPPEYQLGVQAQSKKFIILILLVAINIVITQVIQLTSLSFADFFPFVYMVVQFMNLLNNLLFCYAFFPFWKKMKHKINPEEKTPESINDTRL